MANRKPIHEFHIPAQGRSTVTMVPGAVAHIALEECYYNLEDVPLRVSIFLTKTGFEVVLKTLPPTQATSAGES